MAGIIGKEGKFKYLGCSNDETYYSEGRIIDKYNNGEKDIYIIIDNDGWTAHHPCEDLISVKDPIIEAIKKATP